MSNDIAKAREAFLARGILLAPAARMETRPPSDANLYSEDGVDLTMIRWMLSLTPVERLEVLEAAVNSILDIREQNAKT
jgi:hypothetical protein